MEKVTIGRASVPFHNSINKSSDDGFLFFAVGALGPWQIKVKGFTTNATRKMKKHISLIFALYCTIFCNKILKIQGEKNEQQECTDMLKQVASLLSTNPISLLLVITIQRVRWILQWPAQRRI